MGPTAILYAAVLFLGSFLLFLVQPILGKAILPWFGGTAAVWTTCVLFFQGALLAGYLYADVSASRLRPGTQAVVHIGLLLASVLALPIAPGETWKPAGAEDPTLRILGLLGVAVGLPYLLLAATTPLLGAWYSRHGTGGAPYRLFALSNFASLAALVSYPAVVEPLLTLRSQTLAWSGGYLVFALLCAMAAVRARRNPWSGPPPGAGPPPAWDLQLLWLLLAACASTLLLAVTTHIAKNVAPIPLLWVLPLGIYLASFILCFEGRGFYHREWFRRLLLAAFAAMAYGLSAYGETAAFPLVIALFSAGLFVCCMVCHGELALLKPEPRQLTSFYLMISLGGAAGGAFVGVAAPLLFRGPWELPIGMVVCVFLPAVVSCRQKPSRQARLAVALLTLPLLLYLSTQAGSGANLRLVVRNFYGVLRVTEEGPVRTLSHGVVNHGEQFLDHARRRQPTAYFGPHSGAGLALASLGRRGPLRVGVIGLGAGVLAAYARPADTYRFYEINPLVARLARAEFTFLADSPARTETVLGDGRLSLERDPPQAFHLLAVDAFSGDAIPVHLLTREAVALYFRHLEPGGVLALHLSSTYLDLAPVAALAAQSLGKQARLVSTPADPANHIAASEWVLIPDRADFFDRGDLAAARPVRPRPGLRLWTDDYSNLLQVMR